MSTTVTIIVVLAILALVISILVYIYRCRRRNQLSHVLPTTTTTPICPLQQQTRQITPPLPSFQCPSQKQQHPSSQINPLCNIPTKPEFINTPTHRSTPTNTTTSQSLTKPARIPSRTLLQHAGFTDPTPAPPPIGLRSHATTRIGKRGFLDDFFDDDENGHDDSAGGVGGGGGGGLESEQTTFVSEHSVRAFSGWFGSVSVRGGLSGRGSRGSGSEVGGGGGGFGGNGGNVGNNGSGTRLGMPLPKSGSDGYLG